MFLLQINRYCVVVSHVLWTKHPTAKTLYATIHPTGKNALRDVTPYGTKRYTYKNVLTELQLVSTKILNAIQKEKN